MVQTATPDQALPLIESQRGCENQFGYLKKIYQYWNYSVQYNGINYVFPNNLNLSFEQITTYFNSNGDLYYEDNNANQVIALNWQKCQPLSDFYIENYQNILLEAQSFHSNSLRMSGNYQGSSDSLIDSLGLPEYLKNWQGFSYTDYYTDGGATTFYGQAGENTFSDWFYAVFTSEFTAVFPTVITSMPSQTSGVISNKGTILFNRFGIRGFGAGSEKLTIENKEVQITNLPGLAFYELDIYGEKNEEEIAFTPLSRHYTHWRNDRTNTNEEMIKYIIFRMKGTNKSLADEKADRFLQAILRMMPQTIINGKMRIDGTILYRRV